jgi:hypothetical protein
VSLWKRDHQDWSERAAALAVTIREALPVHDYGDCDAAVEPLRNLVGAIACQDIATTAWHLGMRTIDELRRRNYGKAVALLDELSEALLAVEPGYDVPAAAA